MVTRGPYDGRRSVFVIGGLQLSEALYDALVEPADLPRVHLGLVLLGAGDGKLCDTITTYEILAAGSIDE